MNLITAFILGILIMLSGFEHKSGPRNSQLVDGIYRILEMSADKEALHLKQENSQIVYYSHKFIDDKDDPVEYYLIDTELFVPLVIESNPNLNGTPERMSELSVTLSPKYSQQLEAFTQKNMGKNVCIVIDGQAVTRHKVKSVIRGGHLKISRCTDRACKHLLTALKDNVATPQEK